MAAPMIVGTSILPFTNSKHEEEIQQHSNDAKSIIEKAKTCQKNDPYAAKALLLTAKTLYPSEFCVQFEAYLVEKSGQIASESSHSLIHLFSKFCDEERLREELFLVTSSLQSEEDGDQKFYRELFGKIPEQSQRQILLFCAEICTDRLNKCKLQLLLMKKFPDFIQEYGKALLDSLLELDKAAGSITPCNKYRQLLVTEVLPIILVNNQLEFMPKKLSKFLNLTIEFYITIAIQSKNPKTTADSILKSPTSVAKSGGGTPDVGAPLGTDFEGRGISDISNPWERLHKLLVIVAKRSGWKLECLTPVTMGFQDSFTSLSNILHLSHSDDVTTLKSVFYSNVILFFRSMYTYFNLVNPGVFGGHMTSAGVTQSYDFLIEDLETKKRSRRHKHKKKRIEDGKEVVVDGDGAEDQSYLSPRILTDDGKELTDDIMKAFTTAVNSWQLIASRETFKKDFTWLLHRWRSEQWPWLRLFQIDMHIYRGEHSQALHLIQEEKTRISELPHTPIKLKIQLNVQQASCHFTCGQHAVAAESVLGILPMFENLRSSGPISRGSTECTNQPSKAPSRFLRIVPCKMEALLPYCIQLIYMAFKKRVFPFADAGDTALGHMITLMQYDWPKEETVFAEILKRLTKAGSFSYPVFFTYIINLDFLEEFAYLVTPDAGNIRLDLFPPCITIQRQQRTITRGITRGGKEDFRVNIEKQVTRCEEDINKLIYKFLVTERDSLLQCLNAHNASM